MRRLIEVTKGDDLSQLTVVELRLLIEKGLPEVYEPGMAALLQSIATRENDKTMLVDLASKLITLLFNKRGGEKFLLDVTQTVSAPTKLPPLKMEEPAPAVLTQKHVSSDSRPGHVHTLTLENGYAVHCTCESFLYNSGKGKLFCKHTERENSTRRY